MESVTMHEHCVKFILRAFACHISIVIFIVTLCTTRHLAAGRQLGRWGLPPACSQESQPMNCPSLHSAFLDSFVCSLHAMTRCRSNTQRAHTLRTGITCNRTSHASNNRHTASKQDKHCPQYRAKITVLPVFPCPS